MKLSVEEKGVSNRLTSSDTHAEKTSSSLRVFAEVSSSEREDGRVDGGFEEENDEESTSTDGLGVGESGDDGEEGAHGSPDGDDGGRGEESDEGNRGETSDPRKRKRESQRKIERQKSAEREKLT